MQFKCSIILLCLIVQFGYTLNSHGQSRQIDSLNIELKAETNPVAKIPILRRLSKSFTAIDVDAKYVFAKEMRNIAIQYNVDSIIPLAYNDMAMVHGIKTNYDSAMYYFSMGLKTATEKNISKEIARSYVGIGYIFDRMDNPHAAVENYKKALVLFKNLQNKQGLNQTYINLGSLYFDMNEYKIAHSYFQQVLASYENINDSAGIAYGNFILGNSSRKLNLDSKAYNHYMKSLKIRESLGDLNGIALVNFGLGELYMKQGKFKEAEIVLRKAIDINISIKNKYQEAVALYTLAENYFKAEEFKKSKVVAQEALLKASEVKSKGLTVSILPVLIKLEERAKNYEKAFLFQSMFIAVSDSLDIEKTKNDFINVDFQRMRNENSSLEKNNEDILSKNLSYKRAIIIISSLFLIVVVLLFLYLKKVNEKNKINLILEQQKQEIVSINTILEEVNEELKAQNEVTNSQKDELAKINSVKNKFFSIVSHDLRSPLATLKMLFNLYASGQLPRDQMDVLLKSLKENIYNTADFLDNLLEWSKSQLEGIVIHPELFMIKNVLVDNITILDSQILEKNLIVKDNFSDDAKVYADKNMVNVVLRNILSNSIKFCKEGDVITFDSKVNGDFLLISIKDTGTGIHPDQQHKIFQLEYSISEGTSGEIGHHIGLVLCKDMIEQNKGKIWFESAVNEGTTFFVELPTREI